MYNQDKDFLRLITEALGKDGKSISAVAAELESKGLKIHRLIITGYLRALADQGLVREREIPPSKIYIPAKPLQESLYESVGRCCRKYTDDPDELILYTLNKLLKRPIFVTELRLAGVTRNIGKEAEEKDIKESVKCLRRSGNTVALQQAAVYPTREFPDKYLEILTELALDAKDSKHLVMETRQTTLRV